MSRSFFPGNARPLAAAGAHRPPPAAAVVGGVARGLGLDALVLVAGLLARLGSAGCYGPRDRLVDLAAQQLRPERALHATGELRLKLQVTGALVLGQLCLEPVGAGAVVEQLLVEVAGG